MQVLFATLIAATPLGGDPNSDGLPGSQALQQLVGGLAFWGLLAALAGLIISAAVWALSAHGGNYHHAGVGKRGTLVSAGAALTIHSEMDDGGVVFGDGIESDTLAIGCPDMEPETSIRKQTSRGGLARRA